MCTYSTAHAQEVWGKANKDLGGLSVVHKSCTSRTLKWIDSSKVRRPKSTHMAFIFICAMHKLWRLTSLWCQISCDLVGLARPGNIYYDSSIYCLIQAHTSLAWLLDLTNELLATAIHAESAQMKMVMNMDFLVTCINSLHNSMDRSFAHSYIACGPWVPKTLA